MALIDWRACAAPAAVAALLLTGSALGWVVSDRQALTRIEARLESLQAAQWNSGAAAWPEARRPGGGGCLLGVAAYTDPQCPPPSPADSGLRSGEALSAEGMVVLGRVERLRLEPPGLAFEARIDTGASTSSLDARRIETFERDGEPWVRFEVLPSDGGGRVAIERPQARSATIVQASGETSRPVVELQVTLGGRSETVEFTLADRGHLSYPVLIGRNFLRDVAVVDVGLERTADLGAPAQTELDAVEAGQYVEPIPEEEVEREGDGGEERSGSEADRGEGDREGEREGAEPADGS